MDDKALRNVVRYWGKADPQLGAHAFHPLMFHSLDVAAVMHETLKRRPELLTWFANALNATPEVTLRQLTWIACVHDLGKFAENFQFLRPDLAEAAGLTRKDSTRRHDVVGFELWANALADENGAWMQHLGRILNLKKSHWWLNVLHASTAHHGMPSCAKEYYSVRNEMSEASVQVALEFADWALNHFQLTACTRGIQVDKAALSRAS